MKEQKITSLRRLNRILLATNCSFNACIDDAMAEKGCWWLKRFHRTI